MPDERINLLERWFEEVWNKGRESAIDEMASEDIVSHGLTDAQGQTVSSRAKFHEFWRQFRSAFPDIRVEVHDAMVEGDKVMVRCTAYGTHRGEGISSMMPTHKDVRFSGMVVARVSNNQLVEVWDNWDFLSLYTQLGAAKLSFA
jgi:predicted ester cyclase